jgi:hypothetical protein
MHIVEGVTTERACGCATIVGVLAACPGVFPQCILLHFYCISAAQHHRPYSFHSDCADLGKTLRYSTWTLLVMAEESDDQSESRDGVC